MKSHQEFFAFNRGRIGKLGAARVDLKRTALSAEVQTNWMPRVLGSMSLRPGLGHINTEPGVTKTIPFVFSSSDTAIIEVHDSATTFTVDDVRVTRPAVTATVTNGNFTSNITGWTIVDAGTVNAWQTGGYAGLQGDGTNVASIRQEVAITNDLVEHALRVVVARGHVTLRVGETSGDRNLVSDVSLGPGSHSIAFYPPMTTPSVGSFWVTLFNKEDRLALVDSCTVEPAGDLSLTSPWDGDDLPMLRYEQSGDIVFVACEGRRQRKIIRQYPRSDVPTSRSWSIEEYLTEDGPFRLENTSTITLTPSALSGSVTITSSEVASEGVFQPGHVGALFSITSVGQTVSDTFSAENDFSSHIRVTGVSTGRQFAITVSGTFTANVTLQRSVDEGSSWVDVATYTTTTTTTLTDGLENQIVWYRIGIKTGGYTSGSAVCSLVYAAGSITGIARVTGFSTSSSVTAGVLVPFGGTTASEVWSEGEWSDYRGWPSSVAFHDGRLFWAGKDRFWGSVTDQFYTFDANFEGDAGPISRSVGFGPVDSVNWLQSLNRLIAGTDGAVIECKSTSLDEPLTPTNFTPKTAATRGSARVASVKIDTTAIFAQRSATRLFEIDNSIGPNGGALSNVAEVTTLVPEICEAGVVSMAVQRLPDTRVHVVLADGTVAVLVWDRAEDVRCWVDIETDGDVEDVCILPGDEEDAVYYVVKRTIGGSDVRYLEKWALESESIGAAINKMADSFVYAAGASNTITGLDHLEGETVVAWGGGVDLGTFTVSGGSITLHASTTYTHRCAGLPYEARFKSTKLAYSMPDRSSLTLKKKVGHLGLILRDTHPQGLEYGPAFDTLDPLPQTERYADTDLNETWDEYDAQPIQFRGEWSTDSRLCLKAEAPRACTVLAAIVELEAHAR